MSFDLIHIWASMGLLARLIAVILLGMGVAALSILFERMFVLARTHRSSRRFAEDAWILIDAGLFEEALVTARLHPKSQLAGMVARILQAHSGPRIFGAMSPIERARREFQRFNDEAALQLRRGLSLLASIGSIAPFIGLLGTVVGIISAFQGIAATGSGGLSSVSAGIAEALVETALGLCVAIPAVAIFNALSAKIDTFELGLQLAGSRLLDTLEERRHGDQHQKAA